MRRYFEVFPTLNMAATKKVLCTNKDYGRVSKANVKLRIMLLPKILRLILDGLASLTSDPGRRKLV